MLSNDRSKLRQVYIDAWQKHRAKQPMEDLDKIIVNIVLLHPEYQQLLNQPDKALDADFPAESGQTNPFLHMGMHLGLHEQISTNRPPGIALLYQQMIQRNGDPHEVEHQMMECLGQALWEAQRDNRLPDDAAYLESLKALLLRQSGIDGVLTQ